MEKEIISSKPSMMASMYKHRTQKAEQEDQRFKGSLGYIVTPCCEKKRRKKEKRKNKYECQTAYSHLS